MVLSPGSMETGYGERIGPAVPRATRSAGPGTVPVIGAAPQENHHKKKGAAISGNALIFPADNCSWL